MKKILKVETCMNYLSSFNRGVKHMAPTLCNLIQTRREKNITMLKKKASFQSIPEASCGSLKK